ncbi:MAG: IclR family transcriptional regulator [Bacteroidetes bacterium]|nr:IclR family transcriptional regulator [Bacteroidota bacterium]
MSERYVIPSVDRAIEVLEVLSSHHGSLSLAELGRMTGIPKSSLFRILVTLRKHRCVVADDKERTFRLGSRLWELGSNYLDQFEIYHAAFETMRALAEETGETVFLGQLEGGEVVYTRRVESPKSITVVKKLGQRAPVHCTATGIAMISHLPERELQRILDLNTGRESNGYAALDRDLLRARVTDVRSKGFAVVDGEYNRELLCISAPVLDHNRVPQAALTVATLSTQRPTQERIEVIGRQVRSRAISLSRANGFREARDAGLVRKRLMSVQ